MNFTKVIIIAVVAVLGLGGWMYCTRTDRTNPAAVAMAFTKALKANNVVKASGYWIPDKAQEWKTNTTDTLAHMKSGATTNFFERIPPKPSFAAPKTDKGTTSISTTDNAFTLGMTQIAGKWYVSKGPL